MTHNLTDPPKFILNKEAFLSSPPFPTRPFYNISIRAVKANLQKAESHKFQKVSKAPKSSKG